VVRRKVPLVRLMPWRRVGVWCQHPNADKIKALAALSSIGPEFATRLVGEQRFFTKGRPTRRQWFRSEHWIFKAWGNLLRWDKDRRTR
jgi:hypothetical protein